MIMNQLTLDLQESLPSEVDLLGLPPSYKAEVVSVERAAELVNSISDRPIAVDFETLAPATADIHTDQHFDLAQVIIAALSTGDRVLVVPMHPHSDVSSSDAQWRPLFEALAERTLVCHNASYDLRFIWRVTGRLPRCIDTMVLYGLVVAGRRVWEVTRSQSLATCVKVVFHQDLEKSTRESFRADRFQYINADQLRYAATDVFWTFRLARFLLDELADLEMLHVAELECKLTPVLIRMEKLGVTIDRERVNRFLAHLVDLEQQLERKVLESLTFDDLLVVGIDPSDSSPVTLGELATRVIANRYEPIAVLGQFVWRPQFDARASTVSVQPPQAVLNIRSSVWWKRVVQFVSNFRVKSTESRELATYANSIKQGDTVTAAPKPMRDKWQQRFADALLLLLDYRLVSKLRSTYLQSWVSKTQNERHQVHTSFLQTYAESGRISSRSPNLQNCPRPDTTLFLTKYGMDTLDMRSMFVAPDGYLLITADYSQYELRVAAQRSNEPFLIETYQKAYQVQKRLEQAMAARGRYIWELEQFLESNEDPEIQKLVAQLESMDFHRLNAARIFRKQPSDITKQERTQAKAISFGVLYGMQAKSLAETIYQLSGVRLSDREAQQLLDNYFNSYPRLARYIQQTIMQSRTKGFVSSIFGRKRFCVYPNPAPPRRGLRSLLRQIEGAVEREAVNHTIQATNADAIKWALILIDEALRTRGYDPSIYPVLTVHDELVVQCPAELANEVALLVRESMVEGSRRAGLIHVPTVVEIHIGPAWAK